MAQIGVVEGDHRLPAGRGLYATFDERAFRTVAPLQGGTFTILPADAEPEDPA